MIVGADKALVVPQNANPAGVFRWVDLVMGVMHVYNDTQNYAK